MPSLTPFATVLSLSRNRFFRRIPKIQRKSNLWRCNSSFARLLLRLHIACRISREIYGAFFSERSSYPAEEIKPGSNSISQDNYLGQKNRHSETQIDLCFFSGSLSLILVKNQRLAPQNVEKKSSEIWRERSNTAATSDEGDTNPLGLCMCLHVVLHCSTPE